jgi:antitoxin component of MazEF toxin-antitoxin module
MQNERVEYGTVRTMKLGPGTVGIRIPAEWCAHHKLAEGDTIYCTGHLSGPIEYHTDDRPWAQTVTLQVRRSSSPIVAIPAALARPRGIGAAANVTISVASNGGLFIEQEDA